MSQTSIELLVPTASRDISRPEEAHLAQDNNEFGSPLNHHVSRAESSVTLVVSKSRTAAIVASITLVTGVSSMLNGVVTVILPTLEKDLELSDSALLWPSAITALTCGCTLLLSGSIADAVGAKAMYLTGTLLQAAFVLGCGLSRNAFEIIFFRGLAGIAISFCLPSAVSIITGSFVGTRRNMAFACMGGGQPFGFSLGLVLGGVLTEYATWRVSFYIAAGIILINLGLILWALPAGETGQLSWQQKKQQLLHDIDWMGSALASTSLAMFSYVFASITGDLHNIGEPSSIALLTIAAALVPAFIAWMSRQERLRRPALIPNSLWRSRVFTVVCIAVFLEWGAFNALETILTFYFQEAQKLSPLQTSIRFLPAAVAGLIANIVVGALVHRMSANVLVCVGILISCGAPFAMAFATPTSDYWISGFFGNIFNPVGVDALFTVANLLISSVFPSKTQGLAGGVFNTISQIGRSIGIALVAVIASSVTAKSMIEDKKSVEALMEGYRATFWFCFALCTTTFLVAVWGLRSIGKVGHKRD